MFSIFFAFCSCEEFYDSDEFIGFVCACILMLAIVIPILILVACCCHGGETISAEKYNQQIRNLKLLVLRYNELLASTRKEHLIQSMTSKDPKRIPKHLNRMFSTRRYKESQCAMSLSTYNQLIHNYAHIQRHYNQLNRIYRHNQQL